MIINVTNTFQSNKFYSYNYHNHNNLIAQALESYSHHLSYVEDAVIITTIQCHH